MTISKGRKKRHQTIIGKLLKEKRVEADLTQKGLADRLGMEYYTMVSQMENGYIPVPASLWSPIGEVLNIPTERWLLVCLKEYLPEVYSSLFQNRSRREVSFVLMMLKEGKMDGMIREEYGNDADLRDEEDREHPNDDPKGVIH